MGDRYILKMFNSFEITGQYTLGYKFAGVINVFLIQSFQMAWPAIAWKKVKQPDAKRFFSKVTSGNEERSAAR